MTRPVKPDFDTASDDVIYRWILDEAAWLRWNETQAKETKQEPKKEDK